MKRIVYGIVSAVFALGVVSCTYAPEQQQGDVLMIAEQGFFASGGTVTEPVPGTYDPATNWLDAERPGNTAHVDHANTFYQIPAGGGSTPMVFLHGYGQSRTGWQPRRGAAGSTARMTDMELDAWGEDGKSYKPGDQAWYTHFRIGRVAPERYPGSQFPAGEEAQNQFFRQMTPNTGNYDEELFGDVLSEVLTDVREITGKKSIYVTHSQGGRVGWQTDADNIAAIVAVEPGGTPEIGSDIYYKFLEADIPIIMYFGDYIDNGPEDIMSSAFWKDVRDTAIAFAEAYNRDGGDAVVNAEIAAHLQNWLSERGLE